MKTILLTDIEIDKILTHCESMIDLCSSPEEMSVYQDLINKLTKENV